MIIIGRGRYLNPLCWESIFKAFNLRYYCLCVSLLSISFLYICLKILGQGFTILSLRTKSLCCLKNTRKLTARSSVTSTGGWWPSPSTTIWATTTSVSRSDWACTRTSDSPWCSPRPAQKLNYSTAVLWEIRPGHRVENAVVPWSDGVAGGQRRAASAQPPARWACWGLSTGTDASAANACSFRGSYVASCVIAASFEESLGKWAAIPTSIETRHARWPSKSSLKSMAATYVLDIGRPGVGICWWRQVIVCRRWDRTIILVISYFRKE